VPRILKMPKPPPDKGKKRESPPISDQQDSGAPVSKTTPLAEIIRFPNAKDAIPGVTEDTDANTKTRWLKLADEVLTPDLPPNKDYSSKASKIAGLA
jgi:hypothetical protein